MFLHRHLWGLLAVVLCLAFHYCTLLSYPAAFVDEATIASQAVAFVESGRPVGDLDRGAFDDIPGVERTHLYGPSLLHSPLALLRGKIDLYGVRFTSFAFGALLLFSIYWIAIRLRDPNYGAIAVLVVGFSYIFSLSSHLARMDILAAAIGFFALALHLNNTRSRLSIDFLCGLLLGLGFDVHPRISIFGPIIAIAFFQQYGLKLLVNKRFWLYTAGGLLGLATFYLFHVAPNPETFSLIQSFSYGGSRNPPLLELDFARLLEEARIALLQISMALPWILLLPAAELLTALYVRTDTDKRLLWLCGGAFLSYFALVSHVLSYNLIFISPFVALLAAHFLYRIFFLIRSKSIWIVCLRAASSILLLAGFTLEIITTLYSESECVNEYEEVHAWVQEKLAPYQRIMGPATFWFSLRDKEYYSWDRLIFYRRRYKDKTLRDAFLHLRPEAFILNGRNEFFITDNVNRSDWFNELRISRKEFFQVIDSHGSIVASRKTACNSPLRLIVFDWDK